MRVLGTGDVDTNEAARVDVVDVFIPTLRGRGRGTREIKDIEEQRRVRSIASILNTTGMYTVTIGLEEEGKE